MRNWRRIVFLVLGFLFLVIGVVGLVVPILPTTPFVLLASSCFLRSSPRFRKWLEDSRWFGPMLRDWEKHRAVQRSVKVMAVVLVGIALAFAFMAKTHWTMRALVVVLGTVGLAVIWWLPTIPPATAPKHTAPETPGPDSAS